MARLAVRDPKLLCVDGQVRAGGEPNQIDGVRHAADFIEIVHAPHQTAFHIAPRTEILDMQIAGGEQPRSVVAFGTDLGPQLRPAVKGRAQEGEDAFAHSLVLQLEILRQNFELVRDPFFV